MKIFIQQVESHESIGSHGKWVRSVRSARDFQTSVQALDFCLDRRLAQVQIRACLCGGLRDIVWGVRDSEAQ